MGCLGAVNALIGAMAVDLGVATLDVGAAFGDGWVGKVDVKVGNKCTRGAILDGGAVVMNVEPAVVDVKAVAAEASPTVIAGGFAASRAAFLRALVATVFAFTNSALRLTRFRSRVLSQT